MNRKLVSAISALTLLTTLAACSSDEDNQDDTESVPGNEESSDVEGTDEGSDDASEGSNGADAEGGDDDYTAELMEIELDPALMTGVFDEETSWDVDPDGDGELILTASAPEVIEPGPGTHARGQFLDVIPEDVLEGLTLVSVKVDVNNQETDYEFLAFNAPSVISGEQQGWIAVDDELDYADLERVPSGESATAEYRFFVKDPTDVTVVFPVDFDAKGFIGHEAAELVEPAEVTQPTRVGSQRWQDAPFVGAYGEPITFPNGVTITVGEPSDYEASGEFPDQLEEVEKAGEKLRLYPMRIDNASGIQAGFINCEWKDLPNYTSEMQPMQDEAFGKRMTHLWAIPGQSVNADVVYRMSDDSEGLAGTCEFPIPGDDVYGNVFEVVVSPDGELPASYIERWG